MTERQKAEKLLAHLVRADEIGCRLIGHYPSVFQIVGDHICIAEADGIGRPNLIVYGSDFIAKWIDKLEANPYVRLPEEDGTGREDEMEWLYDLMP